MILILVEDEIELAESIQDYLNNNDFVCEWVENFATAIDKTANYK